MRILAIPVLLIAAAAARAEGEKETPAKPPAPAEPEDPQAKDFADRLARGMENAALAVTRKDPALAREAYDDFFAAAHIRPKDPVPVAEAGLLALDFEDTDTVLVLLRTMASFAPDSGACHFLRGCLQQLRAEYADACAEFRAAVAAGDYRLDQAKHRLFQCTLGLGLQYGGGGLHEAALKTLAEAIAMEPDDHLVSLAYFNMGVSHRRLQQVKEAEKILRTSMERFPAYAPSYGELGELLTEVDRFDDALKVLDMSVRADPKYARGWLLMANAQATRGKFKEAGEAFANHDKRFQPSGLSEYYRGMYLQKKGEPAKAIESLQRALALDDRMVRSVYWIGICHRDLGNEKEAAEYMERWRKVEEDNRRRFEREMEEALKKTGRPPAPAPAPDPADGEAPKDAGGR